MTARMRFKFRSLSIALATLLPLALASTLCTAADTPPAAVAPAAEPLQQLDQVWVHGKKLAREIADTEDDFFQLYNRLNKNSDYDIVCGYMSLNRGSKIMNRICVPGFLADTVSLNSNSAFASYPAFGGISTCGQSVAVSDPMNGTIFYQANCVAGSNYQATWGYSNLASFSGYPSYGYAPQVITDQRKQAYADNVMKVIHSDLRLTEKGTHLARLYGEMKAVQSNYDELKAEARAARVPAKPNLGPRAL